MDSSTFKCPPLNQITFSNEEKEELDDAINKMRFKCPPLKQFTFSNEEIKARDDFIKVIDEAIEFFRNEKNFLEDEPRPSKKHKAK